MRQRFTATLQEGASIRPVRAVGLASALAVAGILAGSPVCAQPSVQASPVPGAEGPAQGAAPQQQVPEVVRPGSGRSEGGGQAPARGGVIAPPAGTVERTPVITPPAVGTMPVIQPPANGGAGGAVSK
jgi:hypothetical protein